MEFSNLERALPNDLSKKPVARVVTIFFSSFKSCCYFSKSSMIYLLVNFNCVSRARQVVKKNFPCFKEREGVKSTLKSDQQ